MTEEHLFEPSELPVEVIVKLFPIFFKEVTKDFQLAKSAFKENDFEELRQRIHKIKGSSMSYGTKLINEHASLIEDDIKLNHTEELYSKLEAMEKAIDLTQDYVTKKFGVKQFS